MNADEIVKALRNTTDFYNPDKRDELSVQAADLIESLQAQLAESQRRERAAIESWRGFCSKCDWRGRMWLSDRQLDARCETCRNNNKCNWQWRGPEGGDADA